MSEIVNWPAVLDEARDFLNNATKVSVADVERKNYRTQNGTPKFTLGIKDNKVVCMWVGNFRKDRIGNPKKDGTRTVFSVADVIADFRYSAAEIMEGFTSKEWDAAGKDLLWLKGQLK